MDLFRKKSVDQLVAESTPLKRTMRTFDLTMLGIGAIIGTGKNARFICSPYSVLQI